MDAIISYFSDIPSSHRSILLFGGLTFFLLIENGIPFFRYKNYKYWKHLALNIFFTLTTILVNFAMAFLLIGASVLATQNGFGLLEWIPMPGLVMAVVGLLLLDLIGAYTPHYIEHHVRWMWQFHVIHHSDQQVDASTANRHHPGESVIRFIFTTLAVLVVGAPIWMVMLYQAMSAFFAQLTHANIMIPEWLHSRLVWVLVTPDMHRVHHHYRQPYSDSNYGNIFSVWDRLFGTLRLVDNRKLVYGLDTYMDQKEVSDVVNLLKVPFAGYRPSIEYEEEEKLES